jgi:hypothetical protein
MGEASLPPSCLRDKGLTALPNWGTGPEMRESAYLMDLAAQDASSVPDFSVIQASRKNRLVRQKVWVVSPIST